MRLEKGLPDEGQGQDAKLEQALNHFKASVHAWSEAEYSRPHHPENVVRLTSWRVAAGWALGCVLAVGSVSGGVVGYRHHQEVARAAAAEAARQKLDAEQRAAKENDELLAKVDNDVSRQVPKAMEPLAQLMAEDDGQ